MEGTGYLGGKLCKGQRAFGREGNSSHFDRTVLSLSMKKGLYRGNLLTCRLHTSIATCWTMEEAAALTFNRMHLASTDTVSLVARNESAITHDYTVYFDSVIYNMYIIL